MCSTAKVHFKPCISSNWRKIQLICRICRLIDTFRCDADSSALARYVLALLKKDKPEKELKRVMIEQLDVFLAEETKPFVERLFEAINSEEYLKTPPPTANPKSTTTDNEDEETSTAEKTVQSSVSDASSLSTLPTSSSNITNVIKQNDSDTISSVTAKITDNVAASSSSYTADRINTPPIEEVSNVCF